MGDFSIRDQFYLDGDRFQIISGGIHYFRIVPEYWRDRLQKLKAMGCNTVETYVPWNIHEPKKGEFCFEGMLDLKGFIEIAKELELWVIVRPSPYICAEWEFGGLPAWLLAEPDMHLRGCYAPFLQHVSDYYKRLFQMLTPMQITCGGPIILFQIENEYGYYGNDAKYLEALRDMMVENGVDVPFVTSDGPWGDALACGKIQGALPTGNFGSKALQQFDVLRQHTEGGPLMCMEFWVGWFDHWGADCHVVTNLEEQVKELDDILANGSVNIYMFIGGTNFGFMNGSNYYDKLTPDVTSYDYDAVLTEAGDITEKYRAFQKVISKYAKLPEVAFTTKIKKKAYGKCNVREKVSLFSVLEDISEPVYGVYPESMERFGQSYGYILYRSKLEKEQRITKLRLWNANDRANIYMNQNNTAVLYDKELLEELQLDIEIKEPKTIDILVENMGRVNFGMLLEQQRKGICGAVQINGHQHTGWDHYTLPFDNLDKLDFTKEYKEGNPAFYLFHLEVTKPCDTYLDFSDWGKGCVFINGFNIGRFWQVGPQKRLYVPGPLLKSGRNDIILFESDGIVNDSIIFYDKPDLG